MKRYTFLRVTLFFTILLSLTACRDEPSLNEITNDLMEGYWKIVSYKINETEAMGTVFTSHIMTYTPETEDGGKTFWAYSDFNGGTTSAEFDYRVTNDGTGLLFDEEQSVDLEISGDKMKLEGFFNNSRWIIEAERQ